MHQHRRVERVDESGEHRTGPVRVHRRERAVAAGGGHPAGQDPRERRLVDLDHETGAGHPAPHIGEVPAQAFGERRGHVPHRARVGQRLVPARQLDLGRHGPRAGRLHLQDAGELVGRLLQGVEIAGEEVPRAAEIHPRPGHQPPPGRLQVDGEVDEQTRGAAHHVRARAAGRQLRQERKVGDLADDEPGRLERVGAGHRAHSGRRSCR